MVDKKGNTSLSLRERGLKLTAEDKISDKNMSLSLRERGLKSPDGRVHKDVFQVALLARAWIEINASTKGGTGQRSRSPCESVD